MILEFTVKPRQTGKTKGILEKARFNFVYDNTILVWTPTKIGTDYLIDYLSRLDVDSEAFDYEGLTNIKGKKGKFTIIVDELFFIDKKTFKKTLKELEYIELSGYEFSMYCCSSSDDGSIYRYMTKD